MSKFSRVNCFGLCHLCVFAITHAVLAAPADAQRPTEREEKEDTDAESSASNDERALLKAIKEQERQRTVAEQQRAEAEEQFRRAMSELERARRRGSSEAQAELARMQEQLEMARAQLAEAAAKQQQTQQAQGEPLAENRILRIYQLRHVKPRSLTEVLARILRNNAPEMAVDERSNSLVVSGNEKQMSIVEELAQMLDRPTAEAETEDAGETLQVRIVWLLDINEGLEPTDKLVSPQVIEALGELGFEHPKVVCQQVTTLTLGERTENRRGQFNFQVPVLIQSQPWQLEGQGDIQPVAGQRFNLTFNLRFHQVIPQGGTQIQQGQLGGSIYTPLGHYTVMGTTTFVAQTPVPSPFDGQPGDAGTGGVVQNQHLSAFVVYLDRAREFPASRPQAEDRNEGRRR